MDYDYTDPTPAPFPSEARLPVAFPLQGRGVPADRKVRKCEDKLCTVAAPLPCRGGAGVGSLTNIAADEQYNIVEKQQRSSARLPFRISSKTLSEKKCEATDE